MNPEIQQALSDQTSRRNSIAALMARPEFAWFMDECIKKTIEETEAAIFDTETPDSEVAILRHLRLKLIDIAAWPANQLTSSQSFISQYSPQK